MPIITADGLPINDSLQREGIFGMQASRAAHQDIRPLEFALLNLMPNKQPTELQFARLLGHTPLQVNLTLLRAQSHVSKNESSEHLHKYYLTLDEVRNRFFDGLIVTGAPVEHLAWQDVDYWTELRGIFDWSVTRAFVTIGICWGAQALLQHFHGIEKYRLPRKLFGIFLHRVPTSQLFCPIVQGLDDCFSVPVSRHTEIRREHVETCTSLDILSESEESGLFLLREKNGRRLYIFNHPEYDADTLQEEYERDAAAYVLRPESVPNPCPPLHYDRCNVWRSNGRTLYHNIINDIYQRTPYRLEDIGERTTIEERSPQASV